MSTRSNLRFAGFLASSALTLASAVVSVPAALLTAGLLKLSASLAYTWEGDRNRKGGME